MKHGSIRIQTTAPWLIPAKDGKDCSISWEGYGLVFLDADSILKVDYLQKGQTINGTYYASILRQLGENIKAKCRGELSKGVLFLQDHAPAHMSVITMATINNCDFELIQQPLTCLILLHHTSIYSQRWKKAISGTHFQSEDDVIKL